MNNVKRIANFTAAEKRSLIKLISNKYAKILEDKKTDRVTIHDKNKAWVAIEKEFNATAPTSCYRSADSLKRMYENRKKELRKKLAEERKMRMLTGGGTMTETNKTDEDTDDLLISIVNEKTLKGLDSSFDSDYQTNTVTAETPSNEYAFTLEDEEDIEPSEQTNVNMAPSTLAIFNDDSTLVEEEDESNAWMENVELVVQHDGEKMQQPWKKYKTSDLKRPLHPALCILDATSGSSTESVNKTERLDRITPNKSNRRRPTTTIKTLTSSDVAEKYNKLLDKRLMIIEKQFQHMEDLHNLDKEEKELRIIQLKQQQELHELEKQKTQLSIAVLQMEVKCKKALLA